jgi:catechol 2,3-dioxygenase-like lactoylglutathione lyase family enzyme
VAAIHHIALETRREDGDRCVAFWKLLGFREVAAPESLRPRARWLQREDQQVHLMWADAPDVPPAGHVAVVAAEYEATLGRLRAAGFSPEDRARHWGSPRSFVRDPAGHRVEIMEFPP